MIFGINAYVFCGVIVAGVIIMGIGLKLKPRRRKDTYDRTGEYLIGYAEALAWDLQYLNQEKDK